MKPSYYILNSFHFSSCHLFEIRGWKKTWENYEADNLVYVHSARSLGLKGEMCVEEVIENFL